MTVEVVAPLVQTYEVPASASCTVQWCRLGQCHALCECACHGAIALDRKLERRARYEYAIMRPRRALRPWVLFAMLVGLATGAGYLHRHDLRYVHLDARPPWVRHR